MPACPPYAWSASVSGRHDGIVHDLTLIPIPAGATSIIWVADAYERSDNSQSSAFIGAELINATHEVTLSGFLVAGNSTTIPSATHTVNPIPDGSVYVSFYGGVVSTNVDDASVFASGTLTWGGDCEATPFCAYGTQIQPGVIETEIITGALISLVLLPLDAPFLEIIFAALLGLTFNTGRLCAGLPPGIPESFSGAIHGIYPVNPSPGDLLQFFETLAWPVVCECVPAVGPAPPPVPPDPILPLPPTPDPFPVPPIVECSNEDICTTLNTIVRLNQTINAGVQQIITMLRQVQSQPAPVLGYHRGRTFSGLTGAGHFSMASSAVGLRLSLTAIPDRIGLIAGDRTLMYDAGWLHVGGTDGYGPRQFITTTPMLVMPIAQGQSGVSYSLTPGVTADIVELLANT